VKFPIRKLVFRGRPELKANTRLGGAMRWTIRGRLGILWLPLPRLVSRRDGFLEKAKIMKPMFWVGILLIVLGALALAYQGFDYTHQEKVLDVGPIHATAEEQKHVSIPPVLGGLVLVGGIALVIAGAKKKS
jgi:uncharacterized membrane protein